MEFCSPSFRAAVPASQALILLLSGLGWGQAEACGCAAELSPSRRGLPSPPQGSEPLPWPSACPLCVCARTARACAQLPCLPFVGRGSESQVTSEEGEDTTW